MKVHCEFSRGTWSGEVEPLELAASGQAQQRSFFLGLHPFRNHLEVEGVGHCDGCLDEASDSPVGGNSCDKGSIELEFVERETPQITDTGEAGAEIIEGDGHAEITDSADRFAGLGRIGDKVGFRYLELKALRWKIDLLENGRQDKIEIRIAELGRRYVDTNANLRPRVGGTVQPFR